MNDSRPLDRTIFLVDGFNLYHSLCRARDDLRVNGQPAGTRWLDLLGLCRAHLSAVGRSAALSEVIYFTALVPWSQDKRLRHEWYLECLKATGVKVRLGRFKAKVVERRMLVTRAVADPAAALAAFQNASLRV